MYQAEIFVDGGRSFANQARLSAAGIPQIAVVHGSSTAGGAYLPGLSRLRGAGARPLQHLPRRPAAGEGRHRRGRDRRGARRRRDRTPRSPASASTWPRTTPTRSRIARELFDKLPWDTVPARRRRADRRLRRRGTAGHRAGRRARALRRARGDRAPRRRLRLPRVQGRATPTDTICGHARIDGHRVGIIGNNGPIQPDRLDQGGAVHPALRPERHAAGLPAEHHRLHGRHARPSAPAPSSTAPR